MQHRTGTPFHRVTLWRRRKRAENFDSPPRSKRGRREVSEQAEQSFLLFAAGVIALVKEFGFCDYNTLIPSPGKGVHWGLDGWYYKAPSKLVRRLEASKFPPGMIATAICELVPLNLVTRGGPGSSSAGVIRTRAKAIVVTPGVARLRAVLAEDGYTPAKIETTLREIEKLSTDKRQDVITAFLKDRESAEDRHWRGVAETQSQSSKGTAAHRVGYIGVTLSRAMASYWRNHRDFKRAKAFLRDLLPKALPAVPHWESAVTIPKLVNATFEEAVRLRHQKRSSPV